MIYYIAARHYNECVNDDVEQRDQSAGQHSTALGWLSLPRYDVSKYNYIERTFIQINYDVL